MKNENRKVQIIWILNKNMKLLTLKGFNIISRG